MNFYDNLNGILKEKKVKKIDLENDLGIKRSTMQAWKESYPSAKHVISLSSYLNISADELLGLPNRDKEGDAPPDPDEPDNIREAVDLLKQLPEREQVKFIGKLEDAVNNLILGA